jgi:hypothetical protein
MGVRKPAFSANISPSQFAFAEHTRLRVAVGALADRIRHRANSNAFALSH